MIMLSLNYPKAEAWGQAEKNMVRTMLAENVLDRKRRMTTPGAALFIPLVFLRGKFCEHSGVCRSVCSICPAVSSLLPIATPLLGME